MKLPLDILLIVLIHRLSASVSGLSTANNSIATINQDGCTFEVIMDTSALGSISLNAALGASTLQDCLSACVVRDDCVAVEYSDKFGCWMHVNENHMDSLGFNSGVTMYRRSDCVGASDSLNLFPCNASRPAEMREPGVIESPSDNQTGLVPLNSHCSWRILPPDNHVVRIQFSKFDFETNYMCLFGNVTLYDGIWDNEADRIDRYCGTSLPPVIHSSSNSLYITLKTGHSGNSKGIEAEISFVKVQACDGTPAVLAYDIGGIVSPDADALPHRKANCSWIISPPSQEIRVDFHTFNLPAPCDIANVSVYDGETLLERFCGDSVLHPLGISQPSMKVVYQSTSVSSKIGARFRSIDITDWACGRSKPAELDYAPGYITSPNTEDSLCRWRFEAPQGKVIKLEIDYFDLPDCLNCGCGKLSFFDGGNEFAPLLGEYCKDGWKTNYILSGGYAAYLMYTSYKLNPHLGFKIKYSFYDIAEHACGEGRPIVLTEERGLITTPGYGTDVGYPNNADCQWKILAKETQVIYLDFIEFGLESCGGCSCDRLLVYNGPDSTSPLAGQYCDFIPPPSFKSTVNSTFLRFLSDRDWRAKGFKIKYHVASLSDSACGGNRPATMSLQPGHIHSPNYPDPYPGDSNCEWLISAPVGKQIELSFQFMEIEYGYYCEFDYLAIYDGLSTSARLLRRICGRDQPANVTSTGNAMLLVFTSNSVLHYGGFKATYIFIEKPSGSTSLIPAVICGVLGGLGCLLILIMYFKIPRRIKLCIRKRRMGNVHRASSQPPPYEEGSPQPLSSNAEIVCPPSFGLGREQYSQIAAYPPPTYEESFLDDNMTPRGLVRPPSYEDLRETSPPPATPPPEPEPSDVSHITGVGVLGPDTVSAYQPISANQSQNQRTRYYTQGLNNPAFEESTDDVRVDKEMRKKKAQSVAAILQGHRGGNSMKIPHKFDDLGTKPHETSDIELQPKSRSDHLGRFSRSATNIPVSGLSVKSEERNQSRLSKSSSLSSLEFQADNGCVMRLPSNVSDTLV